MRAGPFIFACILCFVAGGCMSVLALICASRPQKWVIAGWILYLAVCFALAYTVGGAILL